MSHPEKKTVHTFINKYPEAVLVIGIILLVLGVSMTHGQATNGTNKQLFFDILTIVGLVLTLGGGIVTLKKEKNAN